MAVSWWKNMQQQSGWPLGPVGTLASVTILPMAMWGVIYSFFWLISAVARAAGLDGL